MNKVLKNLALGAALVAPGCAEVTKPDAKQETISATTEETRTGVKKLAWDTAGGNHAMKSMALSAGD